MPPLSWCGRSICHPEQWWHTGLGCFWRPRLDLCPYGSQSLWCLRPMLSPRDTGMDTQVLGHYLWPWRRLRTVQWLGSWWSWWPALRPVTGVSPGPVLLAGATTGSCFYHHLLGSVVMSTTHIVPKGHKNHQPLDHLHEHAGVWGTCYFWDHASGLPLHLWPWYHPAWTAAEGHVWDRGPWPQHS